MGNVDPLDKKSVADAAAKAAQDMQAAEQAQASQDVQIWPLQAVSAPQPLPSDWRITTLPNGWVKFELQTPAGLTVWFMDPPAARKFGATAVEHASRKAPGLIVPNGGIPTGGM